MMTDDTVMPMDENTRRYYLDVMGVQCWQSIKSVEQQSETPKVVDLAKGSDDNLSLLENTIQQCDKCQLHKDRRQAITGRGKLSAELMFVLLAPDAKDDAVATLCSGSANDLLAKMLAAINVSIDDVYISSLLKCCVPAMHTVSTTELHHCNDYLKQQIHLIQPKLLVILGDTAVRCMLQKNLSLDDLRAETNTNAQHNQFESVPMLVSYSPQELLQQPENKRKAWQDLQQIQKIIQT